MNIEIGISGLGWYIFNFSKPGGQAEAYLANSSM